MANAIAEMCIAECYADRMAQFVTRIDDPLAEAVDAMVEAGFVANRSQAVRRGLEQLVDRFRRDRIEDQIVEGYERHPQTEREVGWTDEATRAMIAEEPW
jgi:Arc/MetJ-type ribon-helix-helix transcriptional regulator